MSNASVRPDGKHKTEDLLKKDFRNYLWYCWRHLNLPPPTPVQMDMAHFLQHGPKRLVIQAFRGVGKSWVTSAFVTWLLYCDPQLKILVMSATKTRSDEFSTFTMRLILEMDILAHLRPGPDQRMSKISFDVGPARASHAPSVKSLGINSQVAGNRANVIIADDIEVQNNSDTQAAREKLGEKIKEFDAVLTPGDKNARIIYLGTPQSEQSIYNLLPARGYVTRIWPARFPDEVRKAKYGSKLAPMILKQIEEDETLVGKSTDPQRFNETDLGERELSYGRSGFSLQFMLDTSLSDEDKFPLKLADMIVMSMDRSKAPRDLVWGSGPDQIMEQMSAYTVGLPGDRYHRPIFYDKDFLPYEGCAMFVDPSGRGKDETAWAIIKQLHGYLYLMHVGASREGYSDKTLDTILSDAKEYGVNIIQIEPNMGDGMFAQLLRGRSQSSYRVTIEDAKWAKQQKEARIIDTLEPVLNQHKLVVDPKVIEWDYRSTEGLSTEEVNRYRLFYQLTRITRTKGSLGNDDRLDAVAGCVAYWLEQMDRNTVLAVENRKQELFDQELQRFMDNILGGSGNTNHSWLR